MMECIMSDKNNDPVLGRFIDRVATQEDVYLATG
ncbi:hypothetical protein CathTA2_1577 [Caldalkalibacillus thermarum TA2.A1]|uniref:Uncharacterized protein n=1 Tax=Caldalkalibacillus thermarum (strain TA2.A1) TaxID=986075 RepID=F5L6X7_CALTT|nr:hypothetical protein CathTA2_1577 [Caldalkalibacillus thermarum TA2.A1]